MQPYIICFESIPKLALAPLIILVFGLGLTSKVAIAIALTFVVSTLTAYAGVKALDPDGEKLFYSLGATRWQVFRKLVVPSCLPWIISVLRVNIGLALTGAIVGEFIASQHGLGRTILYAGRPTRSRSSGSRCSCSRRSRSSCTPACRGSKACCARARGNRHSRQQEVVMDRRKFLGTTAAAGARAGRKPYIARAAKHELLVAEPVHSTGYLPMYIAMAKDYFAEADINVKIVTIETGSGHTNAVLSGQAFAFIGGPEHNAFAKAKGAELRAVVHCVDRGNVYFCAAKGREPKDRDFAAYFKGKAIAVGRLAARRTRSRAICSRSGSSTPRRTSRWSRCRTRAVLAARPRQARPRSAARTEPLITQGIKQGHLERAVLQRAEGARPLRLLHHQHPPRLDQEGAGGGARASCAA